MSLQLPKLIKKTASKKNSIDLNEQDIAIVQRLCDINKIELKAILSQCSIKKVKSGDVILRKEQNNHSMFIVLSGKLEVLLNMTEKEHPIAQLSSGQAVGEISLIDGNQTSASIIAKTNSKLLEIKEDIFWLLINRSHKFAINLLRLISDRIRKSNINIAQDAFTEKQLREEVLTDNLTGTLNRRWLDKVAPGIVRQNIAKNVSISVCMLDLDHFKNLNDIYGHDTGDLALKTVVHIINRSIRPVDFIARYGGEEFVVLMIGANEKTALAIAERIRATAATTPIQIGEDEKIDPITLSLGTTQIKDGEKVKDAVMRADALMYKAKENGRNRVCQTLN